MAEVLSHVLASFVVFSVIGWRVAWIDREWVVVAMVGGILPDLNRFELLISEDAIEAALGIPFGWSAIHTLGGVILLSGVGALLFAERRHQVRGFAMLVGGATLHLLVDAVKAWADGSNGVYLYPFSWWRNPTPGWYVSADRWVVVLMAVLALVVLLIDSWRREDGWLREKLDGT